MLTKDQIKRRFGLTDEAADDDVAEVAKLQQRGYDCGYHYQRAPLDPEDIEAEIDIDVEHISALLLCEEKLLRRVYSDALAEGGRDRKTMRIAASAIANEKNEKAASKKPRARKPRAAAAAALPS